MVDEPPENGNANGRNRNGTFAKGWKGGPGRPRRAVEESYVRRLASRCTPAIWDRIVDRAIQDALNGDRHARAWLSTCLIGNQPLESLELWDCYQRVEEQLLEQNRLKQELLIQARNAPPPALPITDPLDPGYLPDPLDKHAVAGPNDEPFEQYWAREREKLRNGQGEGTPPDQLKPGIYNFGGRRVVVDDGDDVDRALNGR
jgi:hypothetical protein